MPNDVSAAGVLAPWVRAAVMGRHDKLSRTDRSGTAGQMLEPTCQRRKWVTRRVSESGARETPARPRVRFTAQCMHWHSEQRQAATGAIGQHKHRRPKCAVGLCAKGPSRTRRGIVR